MNLSHPNDEENEIGIEPADRYRDPTAFELALVAAALSGAQRKPPEALLDQAESLIYATYVKNIKKKYPAAAYLFDNDEEYLKLSRVQIRDVGDFLDRDKFPKELSPIIAVTLKVNGFHGETLIKTLPQLFSIKSVRKCAARLIKCGYLAEMYDFKLSKFKTVSDECASDLIVDGHHFHALYIARVNQLALEEWYRIGEQYRPLSASFEHPILGERTTIDFDFKRIVETLKIEKRVPRILKWVQRL